MSATYLYDSAWEYDDSERTAFDDVRGESNGHFVVLIGYNRVNRGVLAPDPLRSNPIAQGQYYNVDIYRLVRTIMLGILTYDGNPLMIHPKKKPRRHSRKER